MPEVGRYYHTIKHLKLKQVYYRGFKFLKRNILFTKLPTTKNIPSPVKLHFQQFIDEKKSYFGNATFQFLNKEKVFNSIEEINWNHAEYGKLWCYNLNYFNYINQCEIQKAEVIRLIDTFIDNEKVLKDALEPYPTSLRNINWIKYISINNINFSKENIEFLYKSYLHLFKNLEFHLLGNHLIENAFSLLFGAYYFKDDNFYKKAEQLIKHELKEQVLNDGGHFELSPMYHQIILYRLLDCYNLILNNPTIFPGNKLLIVIHEKIQVMLNWLKSLTFKNGEIPMVNDSAYYVAPQSEELFKYAASFNFIPKKGKLKDSGYRKINTNNSELFIDVGNIGPNYIPGHAHSDTFNFILYMNEEPIIIDPGISTYEKNERRNLERSTIYHNTVTLNNDNQSDVWGGFRVGKRAQILNLTETINSISASHDGYKSKYSIFHQREWIYSENAIIIDDQFYPKNKWRKDYYAVFALHFHPEVKIQKINNYEILLNEKILIKSHNEIFISSYLFCKGFNNLIESQKASIKFHLSNKLTILFLKSFQ